MTSSSRKRLRDEADYQLRADINDLYEGNQISANKAQGLLIKSSRAGLDFEHAFKQDACRVEEVSDTSDSEACKGSSGKSKTAWKNFSSKNAARSMLRWMKKKSAWGKLYWAKIPMWNNKEEKNELMEHPFLLPHEWLSEYLRLPENFQEGMPEKESFFYQKLEKAAKAWKSSPETMFPLGMHGDGVPVQGRMNQDTLDFISLNLVASEHRKIRVVFTCIEKRFNSGKDTIEAIFQILRWSLDCLGRAQYPTSRHDGSRFETHGDKERAQLAGHMQPAKACLIQIRADWDWYQHWMGAPPWNQHIGMCWLCRTTPGEWRGQSAEDRKEKSLSKAAWKESVRTREKLWCPLFELPGVDNQMMQPDWLHVMDEGFAAVTAGQILYELAESYEGRSFETRVKKLWQEIQSLYKAAGTPAAERLPKLTPKDIKKPKKPPELDCKASHCRYFCPFLPQLTACRGFDQGSIHQQAVHNCSKYLARVYKHLDDHDLKKLAAAGYKLLRQYFALEEAAKHADAESIFWHAKPKMHFFGHICDLTEKNGARRIIGTTVMKLLLDPSPSFTPEAVEKINPTQNGSSLVGWQSNHGQACTKHLNAAMFSL